MQFPSRRDSPIIAQQFTAGNGPQIPTKLVLSGLDCCQDKRHCEVLSALQEKRSAMGVIAKRIERELLRWPEVTALPHRFGGVEFRVGRRELGHLHGDRIADLPFPLKIREELVASRRASPHHALPDSGWVTYYIRGMEDVPAVIDLFRLNYERPTARRPSNPDIQEVGS